MLSSSFEYGYSIIIFLSHALTFAVKAASHRPRSPALSQPMLHVLDVDLDRLLFTRV
jgi:hypothetical protein